MRNVRWKAVGANVKAVYEGKVVEDVLHRIASIDKALPKEVTAVIMERLYEKFGCYVDWLNKKYVLCNRPIGVGCKQRGRLYWCVVEPPWFFSEQPLPGCFKLTNGYLCVQKDAEAALEQFNKGDCGAALAAMPGRRAEVGEWILYISDGEVYECDKVVSIYRLKQDCRLAKKCGKLWRISKKVVIAYEVVDGSTYVVWQMSAIELLRGIYADAVREESQRYVDYTKRKIRFVVPVGFPEEPLRRAYEDYVKLREGFRPEYARMALPNAAAVLFAVQMNARELLLNFAPLRCAYTAQAEIRHVCWQMFAHAWRLWPALAKLVWADLPALHRDFCTKVPRGEDCRLYAIKDAEEKHGPLPEKPWQN